MLHSVTLDKEKCKGCTTCIKQCPTEAIRVRRGKAHILTERCIDCGQCIRVCPHHAKKAVCDPLSDLDKFQYKVALPAPSLYGQFHNLDDINIVLTALPVSYTHLDVYKRQASSMAKLLVRLNEQLMKLGILVISWLMILQRL